MTASILDRTATQDELRPDNFDELKHSVEHAAHLLPSQGPISAFVHHNTLHMFEGMSFHEAVAKGMRLFDCEPYLPEENYRQSLGRERIRLNDLRTVLREDLQDRADEMVAGLCSRYDLQLAMLQFPLRVAQDIELHWLLAESDALTRYREDAAPEVRFRFIDQTRHELMRTLCVGDSRNDKCDNVSDPRLRDAIRTLAAHFDLQSMEQWSDETWEAFSLHLLWHCCRCGIDRGRTPEPEVTAPVRLRDQLLAATGEDSDQLVNELLIRFCAAFLDQGLAHAKLPNREAGFYGSFIETYRPPVGPTNRWMRGLTSELDRLASSQIGPLESIDESLHRFGIQSPDRDEFVAASLLALRGWAGIMWQMETNAEWAVHPAPAGTLTGYLAIRLVLERLAIAQVAQDSLGFRGPLSELSAFLKTRVPERRPNSSQRRAFKIFQLAQVLGWTPLQLNGLSDSCWGQLTREIELFSELQRRRIFHISYERAYQYPLLDAVALASIQDNRLERTPRFQAVFCIDDREESFRRHLEEVAPDAETYSAAGFYAIAMYYRGAGDAHFLPLCPNIIKPQHYVEEDVLYTAKNSHQIRAETRRVLGQASLRWHMGSRSFIGGMLTALFGPLASVPLVTRILFPRLTARIRNLFGELVRPPAATQLAIERSLSPPANEPGHLGYTVDEMAGIVHRILYDIGLTSNFARLVICHGHGSSSLNNPHESAYNCGACSGGRGGPNARAFAQMANDPRVRQILASRGIQLPAETIFLGGYHNTCDDSVEYFDLDRLPATHLKDFELALQSIDAARMRNAHERCRRFDSAGLTITPELALRHVEARSEDLSQARPEYNHATNAVTIVGRRSRTRGLFLDRRAFLTSYDSTIDDENHTILARILQAVILVCSGISLEYYFSCVDPEGYGCGSKLPHNITSLLGVMTGAASDMRPGLSLQMIEIHEPLRQLFVIETTPDAMLQIMDNNKAIGCLVRNDWVQLATLDPDSSRIHLFRNNRFEVYEPETNDLPVVSSSIDWYRGWRDHLKPALIRDPLRACREVC